MCGRFTLLDFEPARLLMQALDVKVSAPNAPRYNIAPTQMVAAVREPPDGTGRELAMLRWGLIPRWAKDPSIGNRLINARAETVAEKPAFRDAFRHRRCLIPASGFYEWKKGGKRKQPFYVRMQGGRPFAFAGLWELWKGSDDSPVASCTIITTGANDVVAQVHDRMPVILPPAVYDLWLKTENQDRDRLVSLLHPCPTEEMEAYPVGFSVSNPNTDDPRCIAPLDE